MYTRLLQIISLPPHFTFLSQYTDLKISSTLPPVPAQLLVRNLSRDAVFLEAYQTYIQVRAKKGILPTQSTHKYLVLVGETILAMRQARVAEETVVSRILPFIAAGLKMRGSPEFQIACYSLLAILASKRTLEARVLDAAMEAICLGWSEESLKSGILCVSALAYVKEDGQVPGAVKKAVWGVEDLSAVIEGMPSKSSTSKFVVSLVEYGISLPDERNKDVITALVTSEKLEAGDRRVLVQNAVDKAVGGNKSVGKWITAFSGSHTDEFRNLFEMLNLEGDKVSKLEKLTNLELKVELCKIAHLTLGNG
jgi:U3 small nucleolar RNA-associated protein 10